MVACYLKGSLVLLLLVVTAVFSVPLGNAGHYTALNTRSIADGSKDQTSDSFFVAFPRNRYSLLFLIHLKLHVQTTETEPVNVTVEAGSYYQSNFILPPGGSETVQLPFSLVVAFITDVDKAIRVYTNDGRKISLYCSSYTRSSVGAYTALPLHEYELEDDSLYTYYAVSTSSSFSQEVFSEAILVTGLSPANVTIAPTQDVELPPSITGLADNLLVLANETYQFRMPQATTLLLTSINDISGTKITSDVPIAVICSHMCGDSPPGEDFCDHMLFQLEPTVTWGSTFMSQPMLSSGEMYKFISSEDNATVAVTCIDSVSLSHAVTYYNMSEGQLEQILVPQNNYCTFVSDSKILVVQYTRGSGASGLGDPCSVGLTPIEHYNKVSNPLSLTSFPYQSTGITRPYINAFIMVQSHYNVSNLTVSLNNTIVSSPWVPVYAGDTIVGFSTKIANLTGSVENMLYFNSEDLPPMYVLVYGWSVEGDAYCFSLNTGLDMITDPSLLMANFSAGSYLISERTSETLVLNRYNKLNESVSLQLRQCGGSSLPEHFVLSQSIIEFAEGVTQTSVMLTVNNDGELSHHVQCLCLELVQQNEIFSYFRPYATSNVCVQDNEDVSLVASNAIINSTLFTLHLTLSGYNGDIDQTVTIRPRLEYLSNQSLGESLPVLPPINVYITKYISTYTYSLRLSDPLLLDSLLYIDLVNQSNISINTTSQYGPLLVTYLMPSTTYLMPSTTSLTTPTPTSTISTTPTLIVATPPLIDSLRQNPEVFFSFLSIFAALLLIIIIILVFLILISCRLYKQTKTASFMDKERKELEATITSDTVQGTTIQPMVPITRDSLISTASDSIVPVHNTINTTESPSRHSVSPPTCHSSCDQLVDSNV